MEKLRAEGPLEALVGNKKLSTSLADFIRKPGLINSVAEPTCLLADGTSRCELSGKSRARLRYGKALKLACSELFCGLEFIAGAGDQAAGGCVVVRMGRDMPYSCVPGASSEHLDPTLPDISNTPPHTILRFQPQVPFRDPPLYPLSILPSLPPPAPRPPPPMR
eukprot:336300-Hanusia_phi.AAC.4